MPDWVVGPPRSGIRSVPCHARVSVSYAPLYQTFFLVADINPCNAPRRQRLTISHEVRYLLLGDRDRLHLDRRCPLRLRATRSSQAWDSDVILASAFPAELLMPTAMVQRDLAGHTSERERSYGI